MQRKIVKTLTINVVAFVISSIGSSAAILLIGLLNADEATIGAVEAYAVIPGLWAAESTWTWPFRTCQLRAKLLHIPLEKQRLQAGLYRTGSDPTLLRILFEIDERCQRRDRHR